MEQPGILLYNLKNAKGNKIEKLCRRLNIKVKYVDTAEYLEPIGYLAGLSDIKSIGVELTEESFKDEMLIMNEISDKLLDSFLKEYKNIHIEPVSYKAIITIHNRNWNSIQLKEELSREHEAMKKY